jgi:glycosyltransferase involved in cell wall biosynthesis
LRSLRVLFLATRDWYNPQTTGGDNTLWENARYLASGGHEVTFVAGGFSGAAKEATLDGVKVVRLGGIHWLWIRTFLYYMSRCRGRFDVVVTEGFGGSRIPRLAPLYVKEPIVTAWHQIHRDLFAAQYPAALVGPLNLFERVTAGFHRNTWVQAYTTEWKEAFPRLGFQPNKIFVVPVSIRDDWLEPPNGHRSENPTIVWIGKLRRYKCPDHAIRAMPGVIQRVPSAKLILVGRQDDARYEKELRELISALGLSGSVEFRFAISDEEKKSLLLSSRALVLPSAVEGFGIVVLEANACGVPVVASSRVPESVVRDGRNGLRYPFTQIDALTDRLVQVLTDDRLHGDLCAGSRAFAGAFGWRSVSRQYELKLQEIVSERSGRA